MGCLESVPRIKVEHFCSSCTVIIIVTEVARKLVNPLTHHMICVSPTNQLHLVQCAFVASTSSAQCSVQCSATPCRQQRCSQRNRWLLWWEKGSEDAKKVRD